MQTIGERVRKRREELKLSVKDVARQVGMATSTLYDLENGGMNNTTKLHKIAKVLRCTVEYLETGRALHAVAETPAHYRVRRELNDEEYELATEWAKLEEPAKTQILVMIESLVAKQMRSERAKKRGKSQPDPDSN